jgi:hypothetical protein
MGSDPHFIMIDRSSKYWTGTEAADLDEYLRALTAESYPADRIVHARCACGHSLFGIEVDTDEGCARRTCTKCRRAHFVCDSGEYWDDAEPETIVCECGARQFEVAVAFSHRGDASVKWLTVGRRCTKCGTLGSAVDWKLDYEPTAHLYNEV